jgi:hypothetical protein
LVFSFGAEGDAPDVAIRVGEGSAVTAPRRLRDGASADVVVYGPYWAVLVSTLGVAGLLIGKLNLDRRLLLAVMIILSLATALLLAWTRSLPLLISAQVVLALVLAIISIHASRLLHDAVPFSVRAGVSSGGGDTDLDATPSHRRSGHGSRNISPAATAARPISNKPNRSSASSAASRPNATTSRLRGSSLPITDQIPSGPLPG